MSQEFTVQGNPKFTIGETIQGFNFGIGNEIGGKIIEVIPCLLFAYKLDTGYELGPYDDIYTSPKSDARHGERT